MAVVVFDINGFRTIYPHFAEVSDEQLEFFFSIAEQIIDNTDNSWITNIKERKILLYLLVCHMATLFLRGTTTGNIASATEGSVSASFGSYDLGSGKWFGQTPCGALFWQLTAKYRAGGRYYAYRCCGKGRR